MMPPLFRKPTESTSNDESHVTADDESNVERSNAERRGSEAQREAKALSPPSRHSERPVVTFPNLTQHQRESLFHLSLVELQCKAAAKESLNKSREPDDQLSEDHPEVKSLTEVIFSPFAKDWSEKTGLSMDLIGEKGAGFREAVFTSFKDYLSTAAAKHLRQIREVNKSPSSPKAISVNLIGFRAASQGIPSSPRAEGISAPSLMSGENRSPFKVESVYENEYHEMSTLGQGGYGQVFRVRNHLDNQEYAIKKIMITSQRVKRYMEADQADALLAEVRTLAKLCHMNVVRYHHAWIEYKPQVAQSISTVLSKERLTDHRMLPEPQTQETATRDGFTDSLETDQKTASEYGENQETSQDFGLDLAQESYEDNVVFGYSSAHDSQSHHVDSSRVRRASHTTTTSNITLQTSVLSVAEEENDPEVETIPRAAEDIGMSLSKIDLSTMRVAMEQPARSEYYEQDITLYIKMSLHPMTLSSYLSLESLNDPHAAKLRHCFHIDASVSILAAILGGVEYLHSQGIIHRDIKPANIFLSIHEDKPPASEGCVNVRGCSQCSDSYLSKRIYVTPCIGDFGLIAEYKDQDPLKRSQSDLEVPIFEPSRLSNLQQKPVGTIFYRPFSMPKEEPVICPRLDVYSLGVIALELIYPFATKSERATVISKLKQGVLPSEFEHHGMSQGIKSMVCEDRDKRWDCAAVRKWLDGLQGKGKGLL